MMRSVLFYHYYQEVDLTIGVDDKGISAVDWGKQVFAGTEKQTELTDEAYRQILDYLQGKRKSFELPLSLAGTPFQKKVWKRLLAIPYGETCSYGTIAHELKDKGGARAVGMACNKNPIAIIVPCHRVVGSDGKLVGYAGTIAMKQKLLDIEQKFK